MLLSPDHLHIMSRIVLCSHSVVVVVAMAVSRDDILVTLFECAADFLGPNDLSAAIVVCKSGGSYMCTPIAKLFG